jgi:hypothetical protein
LHRRIADLEAKVETLSRPQAARDWDAFKVPKNLPTRCNYCDNKRGRMFSDVYAEKTMAGDEE